MRWRGRGRWREWNLKKKMKSMLFNVSGCWAVQHVNMVLVRELAALDAARKEIYCHQEPTYSCVSASLGIPGRNFEFLISLNRGGILILESWIIDGFLRCFSRSENIDKDKRHRMDKCNHKNCKIKRNNASKHAPGKVQWGTNLYIWMNYQPK